MDNLSNLWGFIKEYSGVVASLPALYYLINTLIIKFIKKDELVLQKDLNIQLEQEKANFNAELERIKTQYTQENEKLKSELSHQNSRLQIAYSGVYKDQVEALKKLYNFILDFEAAIYIRRNLSNTDPDKFVIPGKILSDFKIEFYRNSIFIPESIDQKIIQILGFGFSHALFDKFKQAEQAAINGDIDKANSLSKEGFQKDDELIKLREDFKREIRKILAVD